MVGTDELEGEKRNGREAGGGAEAPPDRPRPGRRGAGRAREQRPPAPAAPETTEPDEAERFVRQPHTD